jgi:hypothetical protein
LADDRFGFPDLPGLRFLDLFDVNFEAVLDVISGVEEGLDALADTVLENCKRDTFNKQKLVKHLLNLCFT